VIGFLARRLGWALGVLLAVLSITFVATLKIQDPIVLLAGPHASARDRQNIRRFYGLDRPVWYQYGNYLAHVARGDLGTSFRYRRPVASLIADRLPRTALLAALAIALEVTAGVALGVVAAARRRTPVDTGIMAGTFVLMSTPTFLSGQLLLLGLAYYAGLFPVGGYGIGFWDHLLHAVLPAFTIALLSMAGYARLARNEMVEILQSEYVRTARAKGLSEPVVVAKHALRNALLPVVTSLGLSFGSLFTGAIVTEAIYAWPGLGRLAYESITGGDVPVIMGTVLLGSVGILLGNMLSDLAYAALDPRIRRA
jgi:peptide/nickel transport system permease protein